LAVKLRLTRRGKKKQPFYRIVAADSRGARDGKYIEKIGHYNPLTQPADIVIDEEKAFYWLNNGAIPTDTVKSLFSQAGIMIKWGLMKQGVDENRVEEELKKWEVLQIERRKKQEASQREAEEEQSRQQTENVPKSEAEPVTEEVTPEIESEKIMSESAELESSDQQNTDDDGSTDEKIESASEPDKE